MLHSVKMVINSHDLELAQYIVFPLLRGWPQHEFCPDLSKLGNDEHTVWRFPKSWGYPQIIHFSRFSHCKPSGYWGTPFMETTISGMYLTQLTQLFCDSFPTKDAGSRMASPENRMGPRPYGTAD